jgi:hypothetical protein
MVSRLDESRREEFTQISATMLPGALDGNEIGGEFIFEIFHGNVGWLSVDFHEVLVRH